MREKPSDILKRVGVGGIEQAAPVVSWVQADSGLHPEMGTAARVIMTSSIKTTVQATILFVVSLACSGCLALFAGAAAGGAGAVYVMGKLEDKVPQNVTTTHEAVLAGLKDLDMPIESDKADKVTAETKAHLSNGKDVSISLDRETQATTKISIRVGTMGDEKQSLEILQAIKKHLPPEDGQAGQKAASAQ
jgi:hypothetical protein